MTADEGISSILVPLDLSAAFDTVDNGILLDRLRHYWVGLSLKLFSSYLSDERFCFFE